MANNVDSVQMALNELPHLDLKFAKVSVLVCRAERAKAVRARLNSLCILTLSVLRKK